MTERLKPEHRRWIILVMIFFAIVLNYFDRQIVSILKPVLKSEFGMGDPDYALLVNVFTVCYAVMYPAAGWLVDRFGAGVMLFTGLLTWSAACLGAGLTRSFGSFLVFRGMLGLAEPTAFPAQLRVVTTWFPSTLRGTVNSLCVAGGTAGAIMAPPVVAWITLRYNWHMAFIIPAVLGLVLAVGWKLLYRNPPPEIEREAALGTPSEGGKFTWPQLWKTRSLWAILACRFVSDPVWYFCLFWLPGYLQEESGLTLAQIGMVGWIPFLAADIGGVGTAAWSDRMVKRGRGTLEARKIMLVTVAALAPVCALTPRFSGALTTLVIFSVVGAVCLSWLFSMSVVIAETFPRENAASVLGIAGGFGAAGAMLFNHQVGQMIAGVGAPTLFLVMACLHPIAALILWAGVRRERPAPSATILSNPATP